MEIEIKEPEKKDYDAAIRFAIQGMHFDWYLNSKLLLYLYGKYFWYLEMNRATQILAAYVDGQLAGVLLAEIYGEEKKHRVWSERLYVSLVNVVQKIFFRGGAGIYDDTIKSQLAHYLRSNKPDGEIIFLAADPKAKVKGIGTALLRELERREPGKTLYLHTDDACTYQFYEHRGFQRVEEQDVILEMPKGKVPLKCLLYSKIVPNESN